MSQKVRTVNVGTEVEFPETGAGMGEIGAMLTAVLGIASAFGQRKWLILG